MRLHPLRKLTILATLLITASMLLAIPVASAQGPARDFGSEAGFLSSLNSQRAAGGLGPLALNGSMTAAADGWALSMATGSFLAHADDIISGTPSGWTKVGENVGRGQSVTSLTSAFMNSPGHRANIMDASYTHIGIAVYTHPGDGRIYTTHRFAALPGTAPVAAAPVAVAPVATAPTAVPTIAPAPTAIPAPPTAVPVQPTPVPATPVPTAAPIPPVVSTPEPEPTPIPATATPDQQQSRRLQSRCCQRQSLTRANLTLTSLVRHQNSWHSSTVHRSTKQRPPNSHQRQPSSAANFGSYIRLSRHGGSDPS